MQMVYPSIWRVSGQYVQTYCPDSEHKNSWMHAFLLRFIFNAGVEVVWWGVGTQKFKYICDTEAFEDDSVSTFNYFASVKNLTQAGANYD